MQCVRKARVEPIAAYGAMRFVQHCVFPPVR